MVLILVIFVFGFFHKAKSVSDEFTTAVFHVDFRGGAIVNQDDAGLHLGISENFWMDAKRFILGGLMHAIGAVVGAALGIPRRRRACLIIDRAHARLAEYSKTGNSEMVHPTYGEESLNSTDR